MPLSLDQIKVLETVNLEPFEIRGAKSGIGNARTTGPLYTSGSYIPAYGTMYGSAMFDSDSSIVTGLSFSSPYTGLDATTLKIGDSLISGSSHIITAIIDQTSVWLDSTAGVAGTADFTASLIDRDYLIEPDKINNTITGTAFFTSGSPWVTGSGTTWLTDLTSNDYIKRDDFQAYFKIQQVFDATTLKLATNFNSSTGIGPFTAKRQRIDQMYYRYTKNDFRYEKNGGFWEPNDSTTASHLLATTNPVQMADGVDLRFVHSINPNAPDVMDSNVALDLVLAKRTTRAVFQFSLPAVPSPEESFELKINNVVVVNGQDYVITYSQDPIYVPPPAPEDRQIANLMFLSGVSNQSLTGTVESPISSGNLKFVDATGNSIVGVKSGTEVISVDGTSQTVNIDYLLDADAGMATMSSVIVGESLVKYVGTDISELMSYGISFYLDGRKLRFSIPPKDTDEVLMAPEVGRVVPVGLDHPAPGDEYIVNYQVVGGAVTGELVQVIDGMTSFRVSQYPLKDNSVILVKNGEILDEDTDFRVSTQTGRINLFTPLITGDSVSVSYYPLVKQVNGLSYSGDWYCTSYGTRLAVVSAPGFEFALADYALDVRQVEILRVYNDTRNKDYDLTDLAPLEHSFKLDANPTNIAIGLVASDTVTINYKFASETLEYFPVVFNNYSVLQDSSTMYLQAVDARSLFIEGSAVRLVASNASKSYAFLVKDVIFDGEDTAINFCSRVPEDIVNPSITVSDSSVAFNPIGSSVQALVAGSNSIQFPGLNRPDMFRPFSIIKVAGSEAYGVSGATVEDGATVVSLSSSLATDWTAASILDSIELSDCPVYDEGSIAITASKPVITTPEQPGLMVSYQSNGTAYITTDSSALSVATDSSTFRFPWSDYSTLADLSNGLSFWGPFGVTSFVPDWASSRLKLISNVASWVDSSTVLPIRTTLKLDSTVTDAFQIINEGITLNSGLEPGQRYSLDYVGRDFIGDASVVYSARYFTELPIFSKLSASFQYDNLDQFYVQVMTQRQFLEDVIEPAVDEENAQIAGGGGQGGDLPADADQGNAEGGLVNDPFRQRDAEIWCRTYKTIYDYFSDRAQALGNELYATLGYKLCNNDGLLSDYDQTWLASKSFNRLWPSSDWTSHNPDYVTPLTGQTHGPGYARFTNGSNMVYGEESSDGRTTEWSHQYFSGMWIRPANSTKDYLVGAVTNDLTLVLMDSFTGPSSPSDGEEFILTSKFPVFDDDGHMGPKVAGTLTSIRPKLEDQDVFSITVDSTAYTSTFVAPTSPPFKQKRLKKYTLQDAAEYINEDISQINATVEWIYDASAAYGYKAVMVIRALPPHNSLSISPSGGTANAKLGFTYDMSSVGNYDQSSSGSEKLGLNDERTHLISEKGLIEEVIELGTPPQGTKLDRSSAYADPYLSGILPQIGDQTTAINQEMNRLNVEIAALEILLSEPDRPDSSQTLNALYQAQQALSDCSTALLQDGSMFTNWMGMNDGRTWALDLNSGHQDIRGKNILNNIGSSFDGPYPILSITGMTDFILEVPAGYDRRILNAPDIRYADSSSVIPGTWTGWESTTGPSMFVISTTELSASVTVDSTSLTLNWEDGSFIPQSVSFAFSTYMTVGAIKAAINLESGFIASGSPTYDSYKSEFSLGTSPLDPNADIYQRGIDNRYSINNQVTFNLFQPELFSIGFTSDKTSPYMITDSSALTLRWVDPYGSYSTSFLYADHTDVADMKASINGLTGFDATGNNIYDTVISAFKLNSSEYLNPRVSVYPGLKPCFVDYQTISDRNLTDRTDYIVSRINQIDYRLGYLEGTRKSEIIQTAVNEELFRATDGGWGNIYIWANNRFNRVQGCESKLVQIKSLIARNKSALTVNRTLA